MPTTAKPVTILVCDDDEDDRMLTAEALAESHLANDLRFTVDGQDALDYLYRRGRWSDAADSPRPGIILLDLNMPRRNGREVLEVIKADPELRAIPVIALTTSQAEEDVQATYDSGANAFISKPVTYEQLVDRMRLWSSFWLQIVTLPTAEPDDTA
jgi:CheY-like chemotaxis protein